MEKRNDNLELATCDWVCAPLDCLRPAVRAAHERVEAGRATSRGAGVPEEMGGGHMVGHDEAMSILRRAEGYCLHKALCSQDYKGVRDYLDAANWLNYLWREMWQGVKYAQKVS